MKGITNAELQVGDRIMCLHMEGETSVTPGTFGIVTRIVSDPFERDSKIVSVDWDNGSQLSLLTSTDAWKKIPPKKIDEAVKYPSEQLAFMRNKDIFKYFDWRYFRDFLYKLRDIGIVNMLGASPLIYAGKDHIDRYYGEGKEENDEFQEFLDEAEKAKQVFISNLIDYMESIGKDVDNMDEVNKMAKLVSKKLLDIYISFAN